ncbi:MAG: GAF domain-containing sensor histidine kinase [Chloroflexi bacterium]|nr:GAF domain-containing sensor histidine kinase [Chloroflexota bacterium]
MHARPEQLSALLELQRELALESDIDKVLGRITAAATSLLDAERATLYVVDEARHELWSRVVTQSEFKELRLPLDGRSLAAEVSRSGRPLRIADPYGDPRFDPSVDARTGFRTRSLLVLPIDSRARERLGVLQIVNVRESVDQREGMFEESHETLGMALAASAGIALEYVRLTAELAQERLHQVRIAEETRHRLARDLHDGVAQTLANTALGIEIAQKRAQQDLPGALAELGTVRERVLEAQRGLRDILFALRPVVLEEEGLPAAVRALAQRIDGTAGSHVVPRNVDATRRLSPEAEAGAFHVIREAVTNAIKTGRAGVVSIDVRDDAGGLTALVEDDGVGFDVAATLSSYASRGSLGMLQMRESARLIGAQLTIDSSPGHGTRVRLRVPS